MKFREPFTGDYDPIAETVTISGTTTAGNKSQLVLPVRDPQAFVSWVAGVLHEKAAAAGTLGNSITTNHIGFALHPVPDTNLSALILEIRVGEMQLSFALPIRDLTYEQQMELGRLLLSALAIMEKADSGATTQ